MTLRRAAAAAAVAAGVAAAAGIPVAASYGARLTGDEPHYLLTATSLAEDASLDVSDELAARRYRPYHAVDLDPQGKRLAGGRIVSPHDPLLPALLAPTAAGGWMAAKAAMAALNAAVAALVVWVAVARLGARPGAAAAVAAVFGASAPIAVYGSQLYPELPAAAALLCGLGAVTGPLRRGGIALAAAAVVALPWLAVKYAPVAAVVAAAALIRLARSGRVRAAIALAAVVAAAGAAFAAAHVAWYGGVTPYAAGDHFVTGELGVIGFDPDFSGRSARLVGLLADRNFGLAVWQPAWLLAPVALGALGRVRPPGWSVFAGVAAAGWLTATFVALTMHGWWWPGRQVVVVLPAVAAVIAWWAGRGPRRPAAVALCGAAGIAAFAWVVSEGIAGRITWVVDFFRTAYPVFRAAGAILPDYTDPSLRTWILHAVWAAALAALAGLGWARADRASAQVS